MAEGFLEPKSTLDSWDVRPGEAVADFGCGAGFFSVVLAQRVGPKGTVYALDVRKEALEVAASKAKVFHLANIQYIRADLERPHGSALADGSVEKVLITNVLFQTDNKIAIVQEAWRILKNRGTLLIIEWDPDSSGAKPTLPSTLSKIEVKKLVSSLGFTAQKECFAGSHHYGIIFNK